MTDRLLRSATAWMRARAPFLFARACNPAPYSRSGAEDRYRAAVAALPAAVRTTFLLHRVDGIDIATIAELTGQASADVEQQLADAILHIWTALGTDPD